jgi:hypothetical protein
MRGAVGEDYQERNKASLQARWKRQVWTPYVSGLGSEIKDCYRATLGSTCFRARLVIVGARLVSHCTPLATCEAHATILNL